jgi:hypothetical protein
MGGGHHLVRRAAGGRSGALQCSTELSPSRGRRQLREAVCGDWVGPVLGFGQVGCDPVSSLPFFLIHFIFFFFCYLVRFLNS